MKSMVLLLRYFYTWRSFIAGSAAAGAVLFVLSLTAVLVSPYLAYTLALLSFVLMLAVPYVSASFAMRNLLSNRSLAIMPDLPLRVGIVVLVLTLLTSAFVPFFAWLFSMPDITIWFGLRFFIVASLYTAIFQLLLPSRHVVMAFSLLPFTFMLVMQRFGETLVQCFADNSVILWLSAVTLILWFCALAKLFRQIAFKPAYSGLLTGFTQNNLIHDCPAWFGFRQVARPPAAGTLLLAYPAGLLVRLVNIGGWVVFWPLVSMALLWTVGFDEDFLSEQTGFTDAFLVYSLCCGCISCWAYGETGARARLIWLRIGGSRRNVWRTLEQQLWINFTLLFGLTLAVVLAVLLSGYRNPYLMHYPLVIMAFALFDSYRGLLARLYAWPSFVEAIVMLLALGLTAFTVVYSLKNFTRNLLPVLEISLLLITVLFRTLAKARFNQVDWQVTKPLISKRAEAMS